MKKGSFKTFSHEVKEKALSLYGWSCGFFTVVPKCRCREGLSCHHKIPNTKANRIVYGEFLQSVYNNFPGCVFCHKPSKALNALRDVTIALFEKHKAEIEEKGYNDPELIKIFCFSKAKLKEILSGKIK